MKILLWILQGLLAVVFLLHGWLLLAPPAEMLDMMNAMLTPGFRIFLGLAEVLAAVGLILPGVTRILPWLTPLAALGVMIVMLGATVLHVVRGEISSAIITLVLLVMATFVAYMRWKVKPIAPRQQITAQRA